MDNDVTRIGEAAHGLAYYDLKNGSRVQRACERWPLVAAVRRALASELASSNTPIKSKTSFGAAALFEE